MLEKIMKLEEVKKKKRKEMQQKNEQRNIC